MVFTLSVTEEEANTMMAALMELPYKTVAGLVQKLNQQAFEQRQAAEKPQEKDSQ